MLWQGTRCQSIVRVGTIIVPNGNDNACCAKKQRPLQYMLVNVLHGGTTYKNNFIFFLCVSLLVSLWEILSGFWTLPERSWDTKQHRHVGHVIIDFGSTLDRLSITLSNAKHLTFARSTSSTHPPTYLPTYLPRLSIQRLYFISRADPASTQPYLDHNLYSFSAP